METKPLLYGLIGFFLGGLIVSLAATNMNRSESINEHSSMSQMVQSMHDKRGDDFDKAFIDGMIEHHEGAVEMAKMAEKNANHYEVKQMSKEIISAQEAEIKKMQGWHQDWGYGSMHESQDNSSMH